jgi:hypothetical protein
LRSPTDPRRLLTAGFAAVLMSMATIPAFADEPADAPSAAPSAVAAAAPQPTSPTGASPASGAVPPRARRREAFHHLDLEPTLVQAENVGGDTKICYTAHTLPGCKQPTNAVLPGDLLRVAGNARWNFNRHLGLHYQRIAHLGIGGRTGGSTNPKYGTSGYDYEELEGVEWTFNPYLNFNTGWDYRATVCCPGAGDPNNATPREKQGPFMAAAWRFGPNTLIGKPFTVSERTVFVNHRFNAAAQSGLARGQTDTGRKNEYTSTIYYNQVVFHQAKVVPYVGLEYYSTYFDNRPSLSFTYRKVFGLAFRPNAGWTYRALVKNDQNYAAGPDATHKAYLQLDASYRFQR